MDGIKRAMAKGGTVELLQPSCFPGHLRVQLSESRQQTRGLIRFNLNRGRKSVILLLFCALARGKTRGAREKRIAFSVTSTPKKKQPTRMRLFHSCTDALLWRREHTEAHHEKTLSLVHAAAAALDGDPLKEPLASERLLIDALCSCFPTKLLCTLGMCN